jgi:hypothetical protein
MVKIKKNLRRHLKNIPQPTAVLKNKFIKKIRVELAEIDKDDQKNTMLEMD